MLGDLAISIGILVGLLAFGTPLPFCFGGALMYMVLCTDIGSMSGLFLWGFEQLVNPVLLCIPLFVFAGALMSESGIADALLKLCDLVLLIFQIFTKQYLAKLLHCMAWNYQAAKQKTFGSTGDCGQWNFLKAE